MRVWVDRCTHACYCLCFLRRSFHQCWLASDLGHSSCLGLPSAEVVVVNQHSQLSCDLEVLVVDEIGHRNIRTGKEASLFEQMDVIGGVEIA